VRTISLIWEHKFSKCFNLVKGIFMNDRIVLLYSGGADSRLLLHFACNMKKQPLCVLVNYGQKMNELKYAHNHMKQFNIEYKQVTVNIDINSGLTGNLSPSLYSNVNSMNVPGRNTLLISIAYSIAEANNIREIWYGANMSDRNNLFPDCYQEFIVKMNSILESTPSFKIELKAPLLGWTKDMVLDYLESIGVSKEDIFSGYEK